MEGPYLVQLQVSTWFTGLSLPTRLAPGFQPATDRFSQRMGRGRLFQVALRGSLIPPHGSALSHFNRLAAIFEPLKLYAKARPKNARIPQEHWFDATPPSSSGAVLPEGHKRSLDLDYARFGASSQRQHQGSRANPSCDGAAGLRQTKRFIAHGMVNDSGR